MTAVQPIYSCWQYRYSDVFQPLLLFSYYNVPTVSWLGLGQLSHNRSVPMPMSVEYTTTASCFRSPKLINPMCLFALLLVCWCYNFIALVVVVVIVVVVVVVVGVLSCSILPGQAPFSAVNFILLLLLFFYIILIIIIHYFLR